MHQRTRLPELLSGLRPAAYARAPVLAAAAAAAVLAATLLCDSAHWRDRAAAPAGVAQAGNRPDPSVPIRSQAFARIPAWHLFGQAAAKRRLPREAPETPLRLKLRGVFYTPGKSGGRAIIASAGGIEQQYAIGDRLPGHARLRAVLKHKVIIERAGRLESLSLPLSRGRDAAAQAAPPRGGDAGQVAQASAAQVRTPAWPPNADR